MATHIPTRELVPRPGHSGHAVVPMGMASGIPRISTSRTSRTIPSLSAADRSMARSMLALTASAIYPGKDRGADLDGDRVPPLVFILAFRSRSRPFSS